MTRPRRAAAAESGSMSLEMVLITPIFIAFLMLLVGVGRIVDAQSQMDGAARDAARAASIARSAGAAADFADRSAGDTLRGTSWCEDGPAVHTDVGEWGPGGRVRVTVDCQADLGGLSFIGLPGTKKLSGTAVAPIDTFTFRGTDSGPPENDQ